MFWRYEITGVDTVTLHFGERIDIQRVERIHRAAEALRTKLAGRLIDTVPSYTTLLLRYDLVHDDLSSLMAAVADTLADLPDAVPESADSEIIEIPVLYHPRVGPDLSAIAARAGLSEEQVIELHSQQTYNVFAIGFAPGFAYLGQVPEQLNTPRQETPRAKVPAGTLGIADTQTAMYPLQTPGGWNLIGRTPLILFDPNRDQPSLLEAGQRVRFRPIELDEYVKLGGRLDDLPWENGRTASQKNGGGQ